MTKPLVSIVMGSDSDLEINARGGKALDELWHRVRNGCDLGASLAGSHGGTRAQSCGARHSVILLPGLAVRRIWRA